MNIKPLIIAFALFMLACNPAKVVHTEDIEAQKPKQQSLKKERIEILHRYPKAPQRNSLYEIERNPDGQYATRDGDIIDSKLIDALFEASQKDLIGADGYYSCRHDEKRPEFVVEFNYDGKQYTLLSFSHCQNEAPWNVVIDNVAYLQMTGEVGAALRELLRSINAEKWAEGYKPGIFELEAQGPMSAAKIAEISPKDAIIATLLRKEDIRQFIADAKLKETKLGCDQEKSPDCKELMGYIDVELAPDTHYRIDFIKKDETWDYDLPKDIDDAKRLALSKLAETLRSTDPDGFNLQREESNDCEAQRALLAHFKKDAKTPTGNCVRWALNPNLITNKLSLPPTLVYYPELDAAWIAYSDEVNESKIFEAYFKPKSVDKFTDPSISIFVQLESGKGIAFKSDEKSAKRLPDSFFKK
ncbi:MAG: hypothetical protein ACOX8U_03080 [Bradymonadia bacterium]|jgi:hypothetical protein